MMLAIMFVVVPRSLRNGNSSRSSPEHFSVVWKGYAPEYSNQTADYYVCINDLASDTLRMNIAINIQNYENSSFWFMVDQYETPPANWSIAPQYFGKIEIDQTASFIYSNATRQKPSSIPTGRFNETIALTVKAYYDDAYSSFYSQANFTVQFHFIDRKSPVWTQLNYYNFDDGTTQGWSNPYGSMNQYQYWRSWPYSVYGIDCSTAFNTAGSGTEAYMIFALHASSISGEKIYVYVNGVKSFQVDASVPDSSWFQYVVPLPIGSSVTVNIRTTYNWYYLDDVYVIRK